ncbi:MAG: zinc ribbon domain-containing protein [Oscillatoriales cyanobacterium C42_A2020_001]|nr:zinc ribbon domain-containing protein [Leptolyngbyaceae cyanobacterium C42_A2020_001]
MPIYEFRCSSCGVFEQWRTMAESSDPAFCPSCEAPGQRIFSAPAINLSSTLPLRKTASEPDLITKSRDREPAKPKFQAQNCGRPWMLNH